MAERAHTYKHGEMDIEANKASFHAFMLMSKWGSLSVASGLLFLVLWFCTDAGFIAAFISGAIVAGLGYLLLREKPKAKGH